MRITKAFKEKKKQLRKNQKEHIHLVCYNQYLLDWALKGLHHVKYQLKAHEVNDYTW